MVDSIYFSEIVLGTTLESIRIQPSPDGAAEPAELHEGRPVASAVHAKLSAAFSGAEVAIVDESAQHKGDEGAVGYSSESHFMGRTSPAPTRVDQRVAIGITKEVL